MGKIPDTMSTEKKLYNFYVSKKLKGALDDCLYEMRYKSKSWIIQKALFKFLKSEHIIPDDADENDYI